MPISITRTSVRAEKSWHDFYRNCTSESRESALEVPFSTMRHAFVAFACIGRKFDCYVELKEKQELFIAPSLEKEHVPILVALAYERLVRVGVDYKSAIEQVSTSNGFVPVVEGWAQGGVQLFRDWLEGGSLGVGSVDPGFPSGPLSPHQTEAFIELVMPEVQRVL